ncbi:MAG: branched-chain amino acid ABC transporter permease [Burkholderiales bacterium]
MSASGTVRRFPVLEIAMWALALAVPFLFPSELSLATSVAIMALFAVSLDLVLGFAGIVTMGHALFFGVGAYGAAWIALSGWVEPVSGMLIAGAVAAVVAAVLGPFILRSQGLPLIMVTLVVGLVFFEAANKASDFTGGDNGLGGYVLWPLLGWFNWSVFGKVEYLYALTCLFIFFQAAKELIASPFGLALQGIRENPTRMALVGAPVQGHLLRIYIVSAFMAGVAGALSAQTTKIVGIDVLSINTSVDVLVMLVLGGVGTLYGGIIGAIVYMVVHHLASTWNPYHWMFIIGFLLVIVVRAGHGGLVRIGAGWLQRWHLARGRRDQ